MLHGLIVLVAGACFGALQLWTSTRLKRDLLEQLELLRSQPASPTTTGTSSQVVLNWVDWVRRYYPADQSGRWTREAAMAELADRLSRNADYQLLQRLSVLAPLMGVLLTAVGLFLLRLPSGNELGLNQILSSIWPLFIGVGRGALVAVINQFLLHCAALRIEDVQAAGRSWFDESVWNSHPLHQHQLAEMKSAARLRKNLVCSAKRNATASKEMSDAAERLFEASLNIKLVVSKVSIRIRKATTANSEQAAKNYTAIVQFQERVWRLTQEMTRLVDGVADNTTALTGLKTAFQTEYAPAVKAHGDALPPAVKAIKDVSETLAEMMTSLGAAKAAILLIATSLNTSGTKLADAVRLWKKTGDRFQSATDGFAGSTDEIKTFIAANLKPVSDELTGIKTVIDQLKAAADAFKELLNVKENGKPILKGFEDAAKVAAAFSSMPKQIETALKHVEAGLKTIQTQIEAGSKNLIAHEIDGLESLLGPLVTLIAASSQDLAPSLDRFKLGVDEVGQHVKALTSLPRSNGHDGSTAEVTNRLLGDIKGHLVDLLPPATDTIKPVTRKKKS